MDMDGEREIKRWIVREMNGERMDGERKGGDGMVEQTGLERWRDEERDGESDQQKDGENGQEMEGEGVEGGLETESDQRKDGEGGQEMERGMERWMEFSGTRRD